MSKIETSDFSAIKIGSSNILRAYLGQDIVYQNTITDKNGIVYYLKSYIKCNGTANTFINLKKMSRNENIEIDFYTNNSSDYIFGYRVSSPSTYITFFRLKTFRTFWGNSGSGGNGTVLVNSVTTGRHKMKVYDGKFYWDDVYVTDLAKSSTVTNGIVTLGKNNGSSNPASARFYSFKWWDSEFNLVYDMIPVQRTTDNVYGMFCKVNNTFYPSNGSAQFSGG